MQNFYDNTNLWKEVIYPGDLHVLEERGRKLAMQETVTSLYRIIRPDGEAEEGVEGRWL
ncbi:hypothetical protein [Neobacillus vireti]|uniref:hypothetical protein n=1 Tax=Neobacillus vireti TaxID=220686 RepID=UPI0030001E82